MSLYEDQIRLRKRLDDDSFERVLYDASEVVLGKVIADRVTDKISAKNATEEILKYYRIRIDENEHVDEDLIGMIDARISKHNIVRRKVELSPGWYKNAIGPMIGSRKDTNTAVAFVPGKFSGYSYFDYVSGHRKRVDSHTQELFDTEAIAFYMPFSSDKTGIAGLVGFIRKNILKSDIIRLLFVSGGITLLGMLLPWMNKQIFGSVIDTGSIRTLLAIGIFIMGATISSGIFTAIKTILISRINTRISIATEAATMARLLSLPAAFFRAYSSGELAQRVMYMNEAVEAALNIGLSLILSTLFSLIYIAQILTYASALLIPAVVVILLLILSTVSVIRLKYKNANEMMPLKAKANGMNYAIISGIQKIKLSGSEKRAFAKWAGAYNQSARLEYNPPFLLKISTTLAGMILLCGNMLIYYMALKGHVAIAEYYAFQAAFGTITGSFAALLAALPAIAMIGSMLNMVKPILEERPEVAVGGRSVEKLTGNIRVDNISFRYNEGMPYLFENFSLKIKAGEYVAIVGKTGCGKSTLMRLLLGFEKPERGAVYYDNRDLDTLDVKGVRNKIGTVMQNSKLMQGSIFSNIALTKPTLTEEEAWEAAEIAGIADDLREMPMGINTVISEGQGGVSGGQKQRILIARAIASKPKVLFFDEATSALDNITQKKVSEALNRMKCTRIVIAHRLSTIRQCDRIVVIDKGKIVEDGTYEELEAQNGIFANLVRRQQVHKNM
ncbi:MAG: ATP-binding cassette domain-containing protein [Lachnospiraceae bacterium]|jgi:NHLM bacteriocin system ABC transporter ATP-binding protein|nr:ATP-binding cassette domain-containing protein [Lachnospiraceae bacterium]